MEGGSLEGHLTANEGGVAERGADVEVKGTVFVQYEPSRPTRVLDV